LQGLIGRRQKLETDIQLAKDSKDRLSSRLNDRVMNLKEKLKETVA
jgi:hypothetical protein